MFTGGNLSQDPSICPQDSGLGKREAAIHSFLLLIQSASYPADRTLMSISFVQLF